ncbi:MAG TPA: PKD domain-containing protein [Solirubrobacteraceae bacterium]|nr:PKD domain-containing protein [Solirubrobacteraceae bacterium]
MRARALVAGCVAVAVAGFVLVLVQPAAAVQRPAHTVDGPSSDVLDLGGVALADDGTGGVVFLRRDGGRAHVFAARYRRGRWEPAVRVDGGQLFDSSWPRIAASRDGLLIVTWVQEAGAGTDQMYASVMPAAAGRFGAPVQIDRTIGEASATYPALDMGAAGAAYLSYTALTPPVPGEPAEDLDGRVRAEFRIARYSGGRWRPYAPVNRDPEIPVGPIDGATAATVAADDAGGAIVAWQEPDDLGIERVWARRVFARSLGRAQQVSPGVIAATRETGRAAGFTLDAAGDGWGAIALLQTAGPGSALRGPRAFAATIPGAGAAGGTNAAERFRPARLADGIGGTGATPPGDVGVPRAAIGAQGDLRLAVPIGHEVRLVRGGADGTLGDAAVAGDAGLLPAAPELIAGAGGTSVVAWGQSEAGGTVRVVEEPRSGERRAGRTSTLLPGAVTTLAVAGGGNGDALVAYAQRSGTLASIGATPVDAAPSPFAVRPGPDWMRPGRATIAWTPAPDAYGDVAYRVQLDGRTVATTRESSASLAKAVDEDGAYRVRVVAADGERQETATEAVTIRIDGRRPQVQLRYNPGKRTVSVVLRDRGGARAAGVAAARSLVRFGDGTRRQARRATHRFNHAGRYVVRVRAVDRAGNATRVTRRVDVR